MLNPWLRLERMGLMYGSNEISHQPFSENLPRFHNIGLSFAVYFNVLCGSGLKGGKRIRCKMG